MSRFSDEPLKIVHVLRAPLGGLFRHVVDLTREQTARGHHVGLICDSTTGGDRAAEIIESLRPSLELGVLRLPMRRLPHPSDGPALVRIARRLSELAPDVVHGHGAKGALYARMPGFYDFGEKSPVRAYTPHGGSFNYRPGSAAHRLYMGVEKVLGYASDLLLFESAYIGKCYERMVGRTDALVRVIVNGVSPAELQPVTPRPDASDLFYIGELRSAKGIDTLLDSLRLVEARIRRRPSLTLVGTGPDREMLEKHAEDVGYGDQVRFAGAMPARQAFELGETLVVPSRAESLPYVVLEAAGAHVPMVATNVGGIPEIFGPLAGRLIECDDSGILAEAISEMMLRPRARNLVGAAQLATYVGNRFTLSNMVEGVLDGYREALARKRGLSAPLPASARRAAE